MPTGTTATDRTGRSPGRRRTRSSSVGGGRSGDSNRDRNGLTVRGDAVPTAIVCDSGRPAASVGHRIEAGCLSATRNADPRRRSARSDPCASNRVSCQPCLEDRHPKPSRTALDTDSSRFVGTLRDHIADDSALLNSVADDRGIRPVLPADHLFYGSPPGAVPSVPPTGSFGLAAQTPDAKPFSTSSS
jgi:hypothetical protein